MAEFDPPTDVYIDPARVFKRADVPEHRALCFFADVLRKSTRETGARVVAPHVWEDGEHLIYETPDRGERLAYLPVGIGSTAETT
ncbi:MAG TPA: hypothetical protein VL354_10950 [Spirochaetia bacterium]|nr:hypothetical protein [Spirochaetia bacterium]